MNSPLLHGESDLDTLLKGMDPVLHPEIFVFTTFNNSQDIATLDPIMMFKESEGTTLIITQATAEREEVQFEFPCRMITLNVHSALDAVGFLARVTGRLAELGMGVNPVAGFYHDHLFIPVNLAEDAMVALCEWS
ncbi:MAG: hypothetical protein ACI8VW_001927 [bacterium]|jgi:hypothetical protein